MEIPKITAKLAHLILQVLAGTVGILVSFAAMSAWEPEKPVELIVPASTGSDLDQKARLIQNIIAKYDLMKQPLNVVNKPRGAGAEAFLGLKKDKGDAYQLLITDNNLFTLPMATGLPFNWKDATPVAMLALEQFVLWTNTQKGYKSAKEYIEAVKAAGSGKMKMGGAGSKLPDHFLTVALEKEIGRKFEYVPLKSGAVVVAQLAEQNVDSTVSNPAEALDHWRQSALTPHCVFDDARMPYKTKVIASQSWGDIPTCREAGIPVDYQMLFGIFTSPSVSQEQVDYFIDVFGKMVITPEWKSYMENGAFEQSFRTGSSFIDWLSGAEKFHDQQLDRRR